MWRWRNLAAKKKTLLFPAIVSSSSLLQFAHIIPTATATAGLQQFPLPLPSISIRFATTHSPQNPTPSSTPIAREDYDDDDERGEYFDYADEDDDDDDDIVDVGGVSPVDGEKLARDIETVASSLRDFAADAAEAKRRLDACDVLPSSDLVAGVLSCLRNDWAAAYTFFVWAGKNCAHSVREYHSMVAILSKMRRFDTAWALVDEMRRGGLVTPQTLLILIRRYAASHDVGRAINTFYALKRFGFTPGIDDFHGLLGALCRYKNVEDAEHLLLCNEKTFPFETKSFNIVLNGWCNAVVNLREAKRFWRQMGNRGIPRDAVSYGSMISCYSKAGSLRDVLKMFNQMKDFGIVPDRKVYNAVVYALAKGKCIDEAKGLVKTMEEKGVVPNAVTFNSLIRPLCKARRMQDARAMFEEMLKRDLTPCIRTYHAFFDALKITEEVFEMLELMKRRGCSPAIETYIMLIRKLCRWRQHESVFRLWNEMSESRLSPDRSAYIVLIHGLFLNGKLEEASKFYEEMKSKGFSPEPKTDEMIQAWVSGKETAGRTRMVDFGGNQVAQESLAKNKDCSSTSTRPCNFVKQPERRVVTREGGFAFW